MKKWWKWTLCLALSAGILVSCGAKKGTENTKTADSKSAETTEKRVLLTSPDQMTDEIRKTLEKQEEETYKSQSDCKNVKSNYIATVFATDPKTKKVIPMVLFQEAPETGDEITLHGTEYSEYYHGEYWEKLYSDGTGSLYNVSKKKDQPLNGYEDRSLSVLLYDMKNELPEYTFTADSTDLSKELMEKEGMISLTAAVGADTTESGTASTDASSGTSSAATGGTNDASSGTSSYTGTTGNSSSAGNPSSASSSQLTPEQFELIGRAAIEQAFNQLAPQYGGGSFQYTGEMTYAGDPGAMILIYPVQITLNGQDQGSGKRFICTIYNPGAGTTYDKAEAKLSTDGGAPVGLTDEDIY